MTSQVSSHREQPLNPGGLAEVRARVLEQARRQPSPTRAERQRQLRLIGWTVPTVPVLIFLASGGVRAAPRPDHLVLETSLGSAVIALASAAIALWRRDSMLGWGASRLLSVALVTPIGLLAWKLMVSARLPHMMVEWSERPGLRCLALSLVLSLAPLLSLTWMRRGTEPTHPHLTGAAIGTTAGAGTWVLIDLWCPVSYVPHLLLGHVLPLLLIIAAGTVLGGKILAIRLGETMRARPSG